MKIKESEVINAKVAREGGLMVAVPKRRAGLFPGKAPFGLTSAPIRIKDSLAGEFSEGSRLRGC
jgi:hypothetical protein